MNLAFIGLGAMGSAMVERLLAAGFAVTVFNRTAARAVPLVSLGAKEARSLTEAISSADLVMSSLLDDQAVLDVAQRMNSYLKPGCIHLGLSTVLPDTAEALFTLHHSSQTRYVSGTVLGVPAVAREGKLTGFCAGEQSALDAVIPFLSTFCENIVPMGNESNIKAPNLMKICINYSLMTALELMSELFVFAEKTGLDKDNLKKSLNHIYGHPAFKRYIDKIGDRDFDRINFTLPGGQKDARLFHEAFLEAGVSNELGKVLVNRYEAAMAMGLKDKDWSAIYEVVRKESGLG